MDLLDGNSDPSFPKIISFSYFIAFDSVNHLWAVTLLMRLGDAPEQRLCCKAHAEEIRLEQRSH
jgi:hypothetical protein